MGRDIPQRELDRITLAVAPMLANLDTSSRLTQKGMAAIGKEGLKFFTAAEREAYRDIVRRVIYELDTTQ